MASPLEFFHGARYLRNNARRLEHLALLNLPIESCSVLDVGAGIGDMTSFFLDRDCTVTSIEPRAENVAIFRQRFDADPMWPPERLRILQLRADAIAESNVGIHDVVFCYGTFNELEQPEAVLTAFSSVCRRLLLMEVAVSSGLDMDTSAITYGPVDAKDPTASVTGNACVPTRPWMFEQLRRHFEHVYVSLTQPRFERYREDWSVPDTERGRHRVIFVASREPLDNPQLSASLPLRHPEPKYVTYKRS